MKELTKLEAENLCEAGSQLDRHAVNKLLQTIESNQNDVSSRIQIIGFCRSHAEDREVWKILEEQLLWLIENVPDHELHQSNDFRMIRRPKSDAYVRASKLWQIACDQQTSNIRRLINASYNSLIYDQKIAQDYFERACSIDSNDSALGELRNRLDHITNITWEVD